MKLYTHERATLLVDGANFHAAAKAHDFEIDYKRLHDYFSRQVTLQHCVYFTRTWNETDDETKEKDFRPLQPLLDWLQYNNWRVVEKPVREKFMRSADLSVEIATDMMSVAMLRTDVIILCSGNGDFVYPTQRVTMMGTRVVIVSSLDPPMCSDALRRTADGFVDVKNLAQHIRREKGNDGK